MRRPNHAWIESDILAAGPPNCAAWSSYLFFYTKGSSNALSLSLSLYVSLSSLIDEEIEREIYWWVTLNNRDRISQTVQLLRRRRTIEDRIGVGEKDNYKCRARGWQLRSHKLTMQCNPRLRRSAISVGLFFTSWSNWAGPRENFTLHTHVPSKVHTL